MQYVVPGLVLSGAGFTAWGFAGGIGELAVFGIVLFIAGILAHRYAGGD